MPVVTIHPTGEQIWLEPEETILAGLYKAGFAYTIGCRRGGCAICKVDLHDGEVSYNRTVADEVLSDHERATGTCLTCRAVPETDITIEMRGENVRLINPFLRQLNDKARQRAEAHAAALTPAPEPALAAGTTSKE